MKEFKLRLVGNKRETFMEHAESMGIKVIEQDKDVLQVSYLEGYEFLLVHLGILVGIDVGFESAKKIIEPHA